MKKIVLTGGGTAGHVTPNIALLPHLRNAGFEIHYIGTANGIERQLIKKENISYHQISAGKLRRYFDLKNFTDLFRIAAGFFQALLIIAKIKPDIVFSKGGFVACPVVWVSWLLRKPIIIHESDMTPGLANKLCIPFARKICYSFPETKKHLPQDKGVHSGLPVRESIFSGDREEGKRLCGFLDNKPVILVICGSQGSQIINKVVRESLPTLLPDFNICHICGKGGTTENQPGYHQFEYVNEELPHLFALSDIAISRSGATTLFELLALAKPALLIPLATNASRGDQILNANSFESQGFSKLLNQDQLSKDTLIRQIKLVYQSRNEMISAMKKTSIPNGVQAVARLIEEQAK